MASVILSVFAQGVLNGFNNGDDNDREEIPKHSGCTSTILPQSSFPLVEDNVWGTRIFVEDSV